MGENPQVNQRKMKLIPSKRNIETQVQKGERLSPLDATLMSMQ